MRKFLCLLALLYATANSYSQSQSYLFAWSGDDAKTGNDFLAVIDADAKSPKYGEVLASVADGKTWPHGFQGDAYAHGTVFSRNVTTRYAAANGR